MTAWSPFVCLELRVRVTPLLLLVACGPGPVVPPRVVLTDEVTRAPSHASSSPAEKRNSAIPGMRRALLAEGWGEETEGEGEAHVSYGVDEAPTPGPNARRLTRFVHLADLQLADDESPARVAATDQPGTTNAAYRPHDAYLCLVTDAIAREISALSVDFVLLGGDNIDNAQRNELDQVLALLGGGGSMTCDTGADDDPVPGAANDPKDAFDAHGLGAVPWLWVTGNHDALSQGNFVPDDRLRAAAIGNDSALGTRDWKVFGGPVIQGPVIADEARALLSPVELLTRVAQDGDGHGLSGQTAAAGLANYAWDVPGTQLRMIVLDTSARSGGSEGVLERAVLDTFLEPALDQAQAEGKWVMLASHHPSSALTDGDQPFGIKQTDTVTPEQFTALITAYPNVLFSFTAHAHRHHVRTLTGPTHSVIEMTTASLADFPQQARLLELWDEDNGWLRLRATSIDPPVDTPLLAEARRLAVLDWTTGWFDSPPTRPEDRNVDVWVRKP